MLLTIIFTTLSALYDKGKRFTNHIPRFIFRAVSVLLISYFTDGNFFINFAQNVAIFYLIFDYTLNILEDRKWNYIGSTSTIDKFWLKVGWISQLIFKIIFLTITTYIQCQE